MCDPFEASMPVVSRDGVPEEFRTGDLRARFFSMIEATPWLTWLVLTKRPENILELVPGRWKDPGGAWPRNLWTGTSVATQGDADRNVPLLLAVPGKHFVSYEPALGWMNLEPWLADLDWIICGGESGPEARVCQVTWLCKVVDHCLALGVPVFVKQLGSNAEYLDRCMGLKDPKGGDMSEWPGGLRVRALPEFWAAGDLHHEGHEAHEGVEGGAVDVRG
jgi:protein gp37